MKYILEDNRVSVFDLPLDVIKDTIPPKVYNIRKSFRGLVLEGAKEDFALPTKIYGQVPATTERIINTFKDRKGKTTGVLMTGEKGAGKSLLTKHIANEMLKQGYPVILVDKPFEGPEYASFIEKLGSVALVFDEFEKIFQSEDQQKEVLSLLDGMSSSHKLALFTSNSTRGMSHYLKNRPGRIFYYFDYEGTDFNLIKEYCNDNLNNKAHLDTIISTATMFDCFNFDMLVALVEELNRYPNDQFKDLLSRLNIKAWEYPKAARNSFEVELFDENEKPLILDYNKKDDKIILNLNPFNDMEIQYFRSQEDMESEDIMSSDAYFEPHHIVSVKQGIYELRNEENLLLRLTKYYPKVSTWSDFV